MGVVKGKIWRRAADCFCGKTVEDVSGGVKCFDPKLGRKASLKEKCADNVVGGAYHAFCLAILWRCVRAREAVGDAVVGEKSVE